PVQINKYRISPHAARRMAQRNVTVGDVALVLRFGQIVYRTSAEFYFLGRRDIPRGMEQAMDALVGTTVVVEGDAISTVYRRGRGSMFCAVCGSAFRPVEGEGVSRGLPLAPVRESSGARWRPPLIGSCRCRSSPTCSPRGPHWCSRTNCSATARRRGAAWARE